MCWQCKTGPGHRAAVISGLPGSMPSECLVDHLNLKFTSLTLTAKKGIRARMQKWRPVVGIAQLVILLTLNTETIWTLSTVQLSPSPAACDENVVRISCGREPSKFMKSKVCGEFAFAFLGGASRASNPKDAIKSYRTTVSLFASRGTAFRTLISQRTHFRNIHKLTTTKMGLNEDLWNAAEFGDVSQVEHLIQSGADVNSRNPQNSLKAALHLAALQGHAMAVSKLLELGADPNVATESGSTALHFAAAYGHYTTVSYLLQLGADASLVNEDGETALRLARFKGRFSDRVDFADVVKVLEQHTPGGGARPKGGRRVDVKGQQMI